MHEEINLFRTQYNSDLNAVMSKLNTLSRSIGKLENNTLLGVWN